MAAELTKILDRVSRDGSTPYPAQAGRYHLYIAWACPFSHRTLMVRALKGLSDCISVSTVNDVRDEGRGWTFEGTGDPVCSLPTLREVYLLSHPQFRGPMSVPVLIDKWTKRIVCNDSAEITRMLNSEFNEFCEGEDQRELDLHPPQLREQVDELSSWIQPEINEGVYKLGFSKTQEEYDRAFDNFFKHFDRLETILGKSRYLAGTQLTLADIALFPTLVRFDAVYYSLFKANLKRVVDCPNLYGYLKELYQLPGIKATLDVSRLKSGYYLGIKRKELNPTGIVPKGPELHLDSFHDRARL